MNDGYFQRVDALMAALDDAGPSRCAVLANRLGWEWHEVRGKLVTLRKQGQVTYDGVTAKWAAKPLADGSGRDV